MLSSAWRGTYTPQASKTAELADLILEKAGVSLLPGSCFGDYGEGYLRLSYATSIPSIERGLARIKAVLK
jgi:aspartate/methionine/tyrosine aminotransferase